MTRIAVIFPSRGLAFSQTCEELLENLDGYAYDIFFAHGLSIPDCFNKPLKQALGGSYTHFWIVEEDMILPKGTLKAMLAEKVPAITCDYPVSKEGKASVYRDPDGNAIYGGTGCLLMTKKFLKAYKQPIFKTNKAWDIKMGESLEVTPREMRGDVYGLHDITFGLEAYMRGTPIKVSKIRCGQRRLIALGQQATNKGEHQIELWTKLKPEILKLPKVVNRNVILKDGTVTFMDIKRAKKLEKKGLVTVPKLSYVELVENETTSLFNHVQ